MIITGKVEHVKPIQRRDYEFLAAHVTKTPKVAIPSPTMLHFRAGRAGIPEDVYPEMQMFYDDVAAAYRAEIADLADAGAAISSSTTPTSPTCATQATARMRPIAG